MKSKKTEKTFTSLVVVVVDDDDDDDDDDGIGLVKLANVIVALSAG